MLAKRFGNILDNIEMRLSGMLRLRLGGFDLFR